MKEENKENNQKKMGEDQVKSDPASERMYTIFRSNSNWLMQISIAMALVFLLYLGAQVFLDFLLGESLDPGLPKDQALAQMGDTNFFIYLAIFAMIFPIALWLIVLFMQKIFSKDYQNFPNIYQAMVGKDEKNSVEVKGIYKNPTIFMSIVVVMIVLMALVLYGDPFIRFFSFQEVLLRIGEALVLSIGIGSFSNFLYFNAAKSKWAKKTWIFPFLVSVLLTSLAELSVRLISFDEIWISVILRMAIFAAYNDQARIKQMLMLFIYYLVIGNQVLEILPSTNIILGLMLLYLLSVKSGWATGKK